MPIRLDRSAWRQLDPISQDETEALLVLDEITATPAGTDAASAATAAERAHAANPGIAVVAPTLSALSAPRDGTPVRSPAPALAKEVVEPRPQEQPTLPGPDPSVSVGMRVLMMMVALPWPALLAGLLGVTLMTVSATAAQREYQRELLHQQLSGIDALRDLAAPQRQLWQARLRAYRQLVSPLDPELLRWSARVQR